MSKHCILKLILFFALVLIIQNRAEAANITSIASGNWSTSSWPNTTRTGFISSNVNSKTISGVNTSFLTELSVGSVIKNSSNVIIGVVSSITSATSLQLVNNAISTNSVIQYKSQGIGPGDNVTIASGHTVKVDGVYTCNTVTMATASSTNVLIINKNASLWVSGLFRMNRPNTNQFCRLNVNSGEISVGSLTMNATTGSRRDSISLTTGTFTIRGSVISGGTANVFTISDTGRIIISSSPFTSTITLSNLNVNSKIQYNGSGNQTIINAIYGGLILGGSGIKSLNSSMATINGELQINENANVTTTRALLIKKDFSIESNATINWGSFSHTFEGSIYVNGGNFNSQTSTVILNGTNQIVGGNTPVTFNNLTLSGSNNKYLANTITINGSLNLLNANLTLNDNHLILNGGISGSNKLIGSLNSSLTISSSIAANLNLSFSQTNSVSRSVKNFTLSRNNGATLIDTLEIIGTLNVSNGNLNTNGKLILVSNNLGTANVSTISSGSVIGNVVWQRFIPGGLNKRKWRFLGFPVNVSGSISINQLIDDLHITGVGGTSNGFDNCSGCSPSLRLYDETISGSSSIGWVNPDNINYNIPTGKGFELFIRGSRNVQDPFLNWSIPDDVTIDVIGTLNIGNILNNLTFTNTSNPFADGYNLISNPYASTIDWGSVEGITRTNMQNYMWVYDAKTGTYGVISSFGVKSGNLNISRYIPPGQAFFVKATASNASIQFNENAKANVNSFDFFRNTKLKLVNVSVIDDSLNSDNAVITFDIDNAHNNYEFNDASKLFNDRLNLYSMSDDNVPLAVNSRILYKKNDTVKLSIWSYYGNDIQKGNYKLRFDSLESLENSIDIYLIDNYLKTKILVNDHDYYEFKIDADLASYGNSRFQLVFELKANGTQSRSIEPYLKVWPNPTFENIDVFSNYSIVSIEVLDFNGKIVFVQNFEDLPNKVLLNLATINSGFYILKVNTQSGQRFIKVLKN